jgi:hypothetical protein
VDSQARVANLTADKVDGIGSEWRICRSMKGGMPHSATPMHEIFLQDVGVLDRNAPRYMERHRVDLH